MKASTARVAPDDQVLFLLQMLEQAARGEHLAWALEGAARVIMRQHRVSVITVLDRERMLDVLDAVHFRALTDLPSLLPAMLLNGMAALQELVVLWSDPPHVSERRDRDRIRDVEGMARILRNTLDSIVAVEEALERADARAKRAGNVVHLAAYRSIKPLPILEPDTGA
ncbi:hypothetical protein [Salinarimonas soli]|uniref:Uncharacterized protein n=1 Tax=Salinarimonas soli TaxID=1638099 RepID=A0A5B2VB08_9HYPH|nr:hypothetical protein [Salinarimonas soli]KAA2235582.1 hypothetical protein F0L46_18960 [Salinarimonas soli]